jgi:hypothetical protein
MYSGTETHMDEARQDQEGGRGLYTLGLACCIGIGVCGTYTQEAEPGEIRYDAFLAHLADGPRMEKTWQSLRRKVDLAKEKGLGDLRMQVCVVDPPTLRKDKAGSMVWSRAMEDEQKKLNAVYVAKAAGLGAAGFPRAVDVRRHHINTDVDMLITRDRRMLVLDA